MDGYSYLPGWAAIFCHYGVIIRKYDRGCIVEQGNHLSRGFCQHFFLVFVGNAEAHANGGKYGEKGKVGDKMHDDARFL